MDKEQRAQQARSKAASILGSAKTERKAQAARQNGKEHGGRPRRSLDSYPCTCGGCPDAPKWTCQRGRNILMRQKREQASQAGEATTSGLQSDDA